MKKTSFIILFAVMGLCVISLAGCNTADGFGKDLKGAGEAIDRTF